MIATLDHAVTDQELDGFYGTEATPLQEQIEIERAIKGLDSDDLSDVVYENANQVLAAILDNKPDQLMAVFRDVLKNTVARRASFLVYGRVEVIKANDVTLEAV